MGDELKFEEQIEREAELKLRRRREGPWRDLAVFGMVGWSVALPTILGVALGVWLDRSWPSRYSWTLMLLALGLGVGCATAWRWVEQNR